MAANQPSGPERDERGELMTDRLEDRRPGALKRWLRLGHLGGSSNTGLPTFQ
jgi:hypothetical protein